MTFPTIPTSAAGRIVSAVQANTTSTRTFPAFSSLTYSTGDLLIGFVCSYGTNASFNWTSWDNGFTEVADVGASGVMPLGCAYKIADGTETGSLTVHESNTISGQAAMILMSIPAGTFDSATAPVAGTGNAGTGTAQTANTLTPAWGALDTLWISAAGNGCQGTSGTFDGITVAPTNYTNFFHTGASQSPANVTGVVDGAVAFRQLNAASEGSGAFTLDTSTARNSIYMVAVKPSAGGAAGTLAATEAADTLAATGAETFTGTLAATEGADTLAATGAAGASGTFAATEAADTLAASGTAGSSGATGTLAATEANDTLAASGTETIPGTLAATEGADTLAGVGAEIFTGTLAATDANDTLTSGGTETFTGTLAATEGPDTLAGVGTAAPPPVTGTFAATEGADTLDAVGTGGHVGGTLAEYTIAAQVIGRTIEAAVIDRTQVASAIAHAIAAETTGRDVPAKTISHTQEVTP